MSTSFYPSIYPLPTTIEGITSSWLTAALREKYPGVTVEDSEIVDMIRGTCTKIRVRLQLDEAGKQAGIPQTFILKGGFEVHSRDMYHMHKMESRAYGEVLPELGLQTPECYFAAYDDDTKQGIVFIEDLVARGVDFCHPQVPQTHEEVLRRLSALAAYHAKTWNSPQFKPGGKWDWTHNVVASFAPYFGQFFENGSWEEWVKSPRGAAASVRFHSKQWMAEALDKLVRFSASFDMCLLHGDTHLGNLYVDPDGTPGFFDPQPHHGPAMYEVTYHICGALDTADRKRWERSLVQHYLDELKTHGVTPPSFDEAMQQYAAFLALGYCIFLVNDTEFQTEAINTVYTARFSTGMLENHTLELIAALP